MYWTTLEFGSISAMQEVGRPVIHPWHCDQFGHMNVRWYAHFFDDANFSLWHASGLDLRALQASGLHTVVAETRTRFVRECLAGDGFVITGAFTRMGTKSIHSRFEMHHLTTGELHAEQDVFEVFFDSGARASTAPTEEVRAVLARLIAKPGRSAGGSN